MWTKVFASLLGLLMVAIAQNTVAANQDYHSFLIDGQERFYLVRAPNETEASLPAVIVLHGGGGNALNAERMTGFSALAQRENFIVVYPEGSGKRPHQLLTWNAGHCCGYAMKQKINDVAFIAKLIDTLIARHQVDASRIYVTGMSNGGFMTHRIGRELSAKVAAIAPVVASVFGDETNASGPVPTLIVNGALDKSIPIKGGLSGGRFPDAWDGTPMSPISEQARYWALQNECVGEAKTTTNEHFTLTNYPCAIDAPVVSYLVRDNGHAWPGGEKGSRRGDLPSNDFSASERIWDFFRQHQRNQLH